MSLVDYTYLNDIGSGSYGVASLYESKKDKKKYVVKKMDITDPEVKSTAESEMGHLRSLRNTYIVGYKDGFFDSKFVYLVMEYCEGGDLDGAIKAQLKLVPLQLIAEDQILLWTLQICLGLKYLHENNVIHRDLKPANIFMTATKQAKIGDFGIARRLKPGDLATTCIGTPLYISPEIVADVPYDGKTDVWSLGCCVYEMMTLHTAVDPFQLAIRQQWILGNMPTADFSSDLTTLTDLMLTVEAANRPTIVEILATDIMKTTKQRMDASSRKLLPPPPRPPKPAWLARGGSLKRSEAGDVILSHGFAFNEKGQLREISTKDPFKYDVTGDRIRNEQRYQQLAKSVTAYIQDHLSRKLKMDKIFLPIDAKTDEARCFVFATPDLKSNTKKLLVLIHGNGAPRVGEWARKVIINDCLDAGSQIPWVKQGIQEGYAVLLLNPNANTDEIGGKHVKVRGNDTNINHVTYVWDNIIKKSPAKQVAFVAHSYGGRNTYDLAVDKLSEFTSLVSAVAFTDSGHRTSRQTPPEIVTFFQTKAKHWVASNKPLDTPINGNKYDAPLVSAGEDRHEWTTWSSFKSVFDYFKSQLT